MDMIKINKTIISFPIGYLRNQSLLHILELFNLFSNNIDRFLRIDDKIIFTQDISLKILKNLLERSK